MQQNQLQLNDAAYAVPLYYYTAPPPLCGGFHKKKPTAFPMMLQVNKDGSLRTFQEQFNAYYPFLKIEFFKKIPVDKWLNKADIFFDREVEKKLKGSSDGLVNIDVNRKRTVAELEKDFEKLLGLSARVFRKSGNVWVETTLTNDWSLEDQNEEGKQISSHFR